MSEELVKRLGAAAKLLEDLDKPLTAADVKEAIAALTTQQTPTVDEIVRLHNECKSKLATPSNELVFRSRVEAIVRENADLRQQLTAQQTQQEPVAWVEVKHSYEGPYQFHGLRLLGVGKHHLYTTPPSGVRDGLMRALDRFEQKERGIPQAHIAAKLVAELRADIERQFPAEAERVEQTQVMVPMDEWDSFIKDYNRYCDGDSAIDFQTLRTSLALMIESAQEGKK